MKPPFRSERLQPGTSLISRTVQFTARVFDHHLASRSGVQTEIRAMLQHWQTTIGYSPSGEASRNYTIALMRLAIREAIERKVSLTDLRAMFERALSDEIVSTIAELREQNEILATDLGMAALTLETNGAAASEMSGSDSPHDGTELPD